LQASNHVGAHPPQTDHSELHSVCSRKSNCEKKIAERAKKLLQAL